MDNEPLHLCIDLIMRNQVLLDILTFSAEFSSSLQDLHFHQVMGVML